MYISNNQYSEGTLQMTSLPIFLLFLVVNRAPSMITLFTFLLDNRKNKFVFSLVWVRCTSATMFIDYAFFPRELIKGPNMFKGCVEQYGSH